MATDHEDHPRPSGVAAAIATVRRRLPLALGVLGAGVAIAASVTAFLPSVYQSTATVAVHHRSVPESFVKSTVTGGVETRLHLISQDVLSTRRLDELIGRLDPYPEAMGLLPRPARIERMRRDTRMEVRSVERKGQGEGATIAFTITHRGPDPATAALVANTLASSYVSDHVKAREGQAVATSGFLRLQLDDTKARLDAQERRLEEFNQKNVGSLPQQMGVNIVAAERVQTDLRVNAENQRRARDRRDALADGVGDPALRGTGAPVVSERALRLARLHEELATLRRQYTDKYPEVARVQAEIADVEGRSESSVSASVRTDPTIARRAAAARQVDAELVALAADERRLRDQLAGFQSRIDQTPKHEQQARQITRDYETTRDLYQSLLSRHGEAQMAESIAVGRETGEQFRIVEPAVAATEPVAPRRGALLLVGIAVSIGLAAMAVVVADQLDGSFHGGDDLRAFTTVPIAATIPPIVTADDRAARRRRAFVGALGTATAIALIVGAAYLAVHDNHQLVALLTPGG